MVGNGWEPLTGVPGWFNGKKIQFQFFHGWFNGYQLFRRIRDLKGLRGYQGDLVGYQGISFFSAPQAKICRILDL